jgi:hypothetical protein
LSGSDFRSEPGGRADDSSERAANEAERSAESGPRIGLTQTIVDFVEELMAASGSLIDVYSDRARRSMRRTMVQAAIGTGAAICAAIWLGASALAVLRGICGGLTAAWGGREWLGDLTGGMLALTLAACVIALVVRLAERRELLRLRAKYERIRNDNTKDHDNAPPASNGGAAA